MKSPWYSRWLGQPLRRALEDLPWFGPAVSAVLLAMLVNVLSDAVTAWGGFLAAWGVVLLLAVAFLIFAHLYNRSEDRRRGRGLGPIDRPNPKQHRGLIFLFSNEETLREAVRYHQPTLKQCWLIVTPSMQPRAALAMAHLADVPFAVVHLADQYNTRACYELVRGIYESDAAREDIPVDEVIADITGGTKPMTAGMFAACCEHGYHVEHVPTAFDAEGKPTGPLPPIEIVLPHESQ